MVGSVKCSEHAGQRRNGDSNSSPSVLSVAMVMKC